VSRAVRTLTPFVVAFLVPSVALGVLYALGGRSPLWGLVGGAIGLLGALAATATRVLLAPRMSESEVEALARELDEQEHWQDWGYRAPDSASDHEHEGLRRMHEDIDRDEERRDEERRRDE